MSSFVGTSTRAEEAIQRVQRLFGQLSTEVLQIEGAVRSGTQGWQGALATEFRDVVVPEKMGQWREFDSVCKRVFTTALQVQDNIQRAGGNR